MAMTAKQKLCTHSAPVTWKYIVYKTTCLVNGKIYIGVHRTEDPNVFDGYIGCGMTSANPALHKTVFHKAVHKYGYHNFKRETLYVFDHKKPAYKKEAEIVTPEFIAMNDNYNTAIGGGGGSKKAKPVYQFNVKGELLCKYDNVYDAAKTINSPFQSVRNAIQTKGIHHDSLWAWTPVIDISMYNTKLDYKYYIYNENGELIAEELRNKEVMELLHTTSANIHFSIKTTGKLKGYFITTEKVEKVRIKVAPITNAKLNQYTADGNLVASYLTIQEAKQTTGLKLLSITSAINTHRKCNGYYWTRNDNPPQTINIKTFRLQNEYKYSPEQ